MTIPDNKHRAKQMACIVRRRDDSYKKGGIAPRGSKNYKHHVDDLYVPHDKNGELYVPHNYTNIIVQDNSDYYKPKQFEYQELPDASDFPELTSKLRDNTSSSADNASNSGSASEFWGKKMQKELWIDGSLSKKNQRKSKKALLQQKRSKAEKNLLQRLNSSTISSPTNSVTSLPENASRRSKRSTRAFKNACEQDQNLTPIDWSTQGIPMELKQTGKMSMELKKKARHLEKLRELSKQKRISYGKTISQEISRKGKSKAAKTFPCVLRNHQHSSN